MYEEHEACRSREKALIRENGELEAEVDRLRMELHLANAERRLAMRALRLLEYALSRKSSDQPTPEECSRNPNQPTPEECSRNPH